MRSQMFEFAGSREQRIEIAVEYECDKGQVAFAGVRSLRVNGTHIEDEALALRFLSTGVPKWPESLDCGDC